MKSTLVFLFIVFCTFASLSECRYSSRHHSHVEHRARFNGWNLDREEREKPSHDRPSNDNSTSYRPAPNAPVVHTSWGTFEGTIETHSGVNVSTFYGIPFAEPPVGKLRFRLPLKLRGRYQGIYNATAPRAACVHSLENEKTIEETSEDCLFLNIWIPRENDYEDDRWSRRNSDHKWGRRNSYSRSKPRSRSSRGLPVLFYIYGSQFKKYSASYPSSRGGVTAAQGNMIFVSPNYRLGSLGFAYGNDHRMPGNQAVYDVITAMEWVRDNIADFGGDPDRITLSGSSAGSIIAGILAVSPNVNPFLFDQVLLMSAVPIRPTSIESTDVALNKTKALAAKLGCGEFPNELFGLTVDQIECLQNVNASDFIAIDTTEEFTIMGSTPDYAFMPVYGDSLLPSPPDYYLSRNQIRRHVKFMVGSDRNDDIETKNYEPASREDAEKYLDNYLINAIKPKSNISDELDYLYDYYFDDVADNDTYGIKERMDQLVGDYIFQCPLLLFAERWANVNPVHYYYNNYTADRYINSTEVQFQHGPVHGQANFMFLGRPFGVEQELYSDQDRLVSHRMIKILSEFVTLGEVAWPPLLVSRGKTLPLEWIIDEDVNTHNVKVSPKLKICHFWAKMFNVFQF